MERYSATFLMQILMFTIVIAAGGSIDLQAQEDLGESLRVSQLVEEAMERNPEILSAKNRLQSALEIVEARRALPDPEISYTYFVKEVETRVGPQEQIFGAKQKFPFYGKRDARAEVAAKEAEAAEAYYETVRHEVSRQVKRAYFELYYISTIEDVTNAEKDILKRFERIARTKYQTGEGNQQNILKAHVEITKLDDKLLALRGQKQTAQATLNTGITGFR